MTRGQDGLLSLRLFHSWLHAGLSRRLQPFRHGPESAPKSHL